MFGNLNPYATAALVHVDGEIEPIELTDLAAATQLTLFSDLAVEPLRANRRGVPDLAAG